MKYSFVAAALAAPILAAPAKRQASNIDVTVLQFALTLEHLEDTFYRGALQKFTADDFVKAGYGAKYYNNLKFIASDEQSHVSFLSTALTAAGATPVAECVYNFPYSTVDQFITLSSILEGVGTSAYLGGAPLITSKAYLTAAGSILVTEALHTSMQRIAVNEIPFPTPYGTPLDPTSVYTLAAAFIKSCPASNAALPFKPYPALTLLTAGGEQEGPAGKLAKRNWDGQSWGANEWGQVQQAAHTTYTTTTTTITGSHYATPAPSPSPSAAPAKLTPATKQGTVVKFTSGASVPAGSFITFVSGLQIVSVKATTDGMTVSAAVPNTVAGQVYALLTSTAANGTLANVVAGPAILEIQPAAPALSYSTA